MEQSNCIDICILVPKGLVKCHGQLNVHFVKMNYAISKWAGNS